VASSASRKGSAAMIIVNDLHKTFVRQGKVSTKNITDIARLLGLMKKKMK
jgi:hypothetical protein